MGVEVCQTPVGAWGAAREQSRGKDTPSGHWELMGCPVSFDWGYFHKSADPLKPVFPEPLMQRWYAECGLAGSLGNCHASGTEIIDRLGDEHVRTGMPIVYTSSDSVFQVAAHETHFGLDQLYRICEVAKALVDEINIARVIARPFEGEAGHYRRTGRRHDYTTPPPTPTLLDALAEAGREVHGIGKIRDIFAERGVTHHRGADGNRALCEETLKAMDACADGGLVFANLVDFDMLFGHRRDVAGYGAALEEFDEWLGGFLTRIAQDDLVVITADHGNDPTFRGTDHTREQVPLFVLHGAASRELGTRSSFADVAATLAEYFNLPAPWPAGCSFLKPAAT
jgi:phosphopentomutase